MTQRIFRSICLVTVFVLLATLIATVPISLRYCTQTLKDGLKLEARYIAEGLKLGGIDFLKDTSTEASSRITLISADGSIIYDTAADIAEMENHLDRGEIVSAMRDGDGYSVRYSDTQAEKTVYYALKLDDGSFLRVSGNAVSFLALLSGLTPAAVIIFIGALAVSVLFALSSSKRIVKGVELLASDSTEEEELYPELVEVFHRIKEQKRLINRQIDELEVRRHELEVITENMDDGLILIDAKANILSCNRSALKLIGQAPNGADTPSGNLSTLPLELADIRSTVRSALLGKRLECTARSGEKIYRIIADPVMSEGAVSGAAVLILDETEKEKREELRREFTSNVSHELKTPLTSISGFAELIRAGISGENTEHFIDNIFRESQRLIVLVNDIIKLSRLDEGAISPQIENVSVRAICESVAERLRGVAEKRGITVSVIGDDVKAPTDARMLEEIIYNLCDNSVKYGKDGGSVEMKAETLTDGTLTLTVEDDGIGIPSDQLDRIFERFYRVDKSHSKEIGGTGLGLSIVKHSASRLGIELSVSSAVGVGTRITLTFPKHLTQI